VSCRGEARASARAIVTSLTTGTEFIVAFYLVAELRCYTPRRVHRKVSSGPRLCRVARCIVALVLIDCASVPRPTALAFC
jgi:hypothetical protein